MRRALAGGGDRNGAEPACAARSRDGAELRRLLTSSIRDQPPIVLLDNWDDLRSASLAAILTAESFADRQIGTSQTFCSRNRSLIVAVGNNLQLGPEIARRTVPIHLGLSGQDPLKRKDDRISEPQDWTRRHRSRLLAAVLAMVEAWKAAGRPESPLRLPSFEPWSRLVGGILLANGVEGFLENLDLSCARGDAKWVDFFRAWSLRFGSQPVLAADLLPLAHEAGVADEGETAVQLGRKLSARAGSVFGGYQLEPAGRSDSTARYRLICVSRTGSACMPADDAAPGAANFLQ